MSETDWSALPPHGTVWGCPACGRVWRKRRMDGGDTSCVVYAELWRDDETLKLGDNGMAVAAALARTPEPTT